LRKLLELNVPARSTAERNGRVKSDNVAGNDIRHFRLKERNMAEIKPNDVAGALECFRPLIAEDSSERYLVPISGRAMKTIIESLRGSRKNAPHHERVSEQAGPELARA
jgi:hypothetical protein